MDFAIANTPTLDYLREKENARIQRYKEGTRGALPEDWYELTQELPPFDEDSADACPACGSTNVEICRPPRHDRKKFGNCENCNHAWAM